MPKGIVIGILAAVCLMIGCTGNKAQMLQLLEELEATNRAGKELLNDSLAEELVDYFDRHGSNNERMRSRYMLGRTYYFLDELPRALEIYNEAADCADTTSADCDYKVLSRIHAQKAVIFNMQIQPRSQLKELRHAVYYAKKGMDTLQAIECFAQQSTVYELLKKNDSVSIITEKASKLFEQIGEFDRANQIVGLEISALLDMDEVEKAGHCIKKYESSSAFDSLGNISRGIEIFYYVKGKYYLSVGKMDSAEYLFRKELEEGKDLNNQIAGCKGLQRVFERKEIPDSIAKYANLGYTFNDSAYSLSEMQNIQRLQASYNYNHKKQLAEQKAREAERAWLIVVILSLVVFIVGIIFGRKYHILNCAALDYRLKNANITRHLKKLANSNPPRYPNIDDWDKLQMLVERKIPSFRKTVKADDLPLTEMEYDVCLMIRVQILPIEMSKLKQCSPSHISNIRKRLLFTICGKEGSSDDFDDFIGHIN
jgi:tetratricopeptide (TPR) repeat protein